MYRWWVFLHIAGVFGFLTAHGVSVFVAFRLRKEREPGRVNALLELSGSSMWLFYVSLLALLGGGVAAGFVGDWWGTGWIWTALGLLLATMFAMYAIASPYYRRIRLVAAEMAQGAQAVTEEQLAEALRSPRPYVLAGVGGTAILVILWLMIFKPF